jgi:single-stranded DNA-binding protein
VITVLAGGTLYGAPQKKTSARGTSFVSGKMRVSTSNGETIFVGIVAFRESVGQALLALADGAALSVAGDLKASAYTAKDGTVRASLDITVNEVLTAAHVDKRRKAMRESRNCQEQAPAAAQSPSTNGGEDFDDPIPF